MQKFIAVAVVETFLEIQVEVSDEDYNKLTGATPASEEEWQEIIDEVSELTADRISDLNKIIGEPYTFKYLLCGEDYGGDSIFDA